MITHHIVLDEQGEGAKHLIRQFRGQCEGRATTFITWLVANRPLNDKAPPEEAFDIGEPDALVGDWTVKGRDYTVIIHEDGDRPQLSYVTLVESRKAPVNSAS